MKMFKGKDEGVELPKNEYVKLVHFLVKAGFFFFGSSILILLIVIVGIPLIAGSMKKGSSYVDYLRSVTAYEERLAANHAGLYRPAVDHQKTFRLPPKRVEDGGEAQPMEIPDERLEEVANPYTRTTHVHAARALVDRIISEELIARQKGVFVRRDTDRTDTQEINQHAEQSGTVDEVAKIHSWLNDHVDDNTLAVIREMLIIWLSRMSAALSTIFCFSFLIVAAFFLGEAKARILEEEGNMPMAERSKWFFRGILFLPPLVTTLPVIPVPWNILIIIPFIMTALAVVVFFFRANFIEI
jgi:hypothetical protein